MDINSPTDSNAVLAVSGHRAETSTGAASSTVQHLDKGDQWANGITTYNDADRLRIPTRLVPYTRHPIYAAGYNQGTFKRL